MARNKITDLNDHLFAQLERLNDETMKSDKMEIEFQKAKAISGVAAQIIKANKLTLDAMRILKDGSVGPNDMPDTFGLKQLKAVS
jgi:hypothetical protein